ncbi:MAG TPA: DUF4440 domain-containing protein [Lysobacter sp.]|nr:DUF4440 domain-containing protein [Lysobacter sp.]
MPARLAAVALLAALPAFAQTPPAAPAPPAPPAPKLSADECAVWARELSFARSVAEHDAAAFAEHLHPGAAFGVKQPQPQRGRDAITRAWTPLIEGKTIKLEWYPSMVVIGGEGDIAMSTGPALYEDLRQDANPRFRLGGFQSVWKRGDDGVWRVLFDDGIRPQPADEAAVAAFRAGRKLDCPRG